MVRYSQIVVYNVYCGIDRYEYDTNKQADLSERDLLNEYAHWQVLLGYVRVV